MNHTFVDAAVQMERRLQQHDWPYRPLRVSRRDAPQILGGGAYVNETTADRCKPCGNHQSFNTCTLGRRSLDARRGTAIDFVVGDAAEKIILPEITTQ